MLVRTILFFITILLLNSCIIDNNIEGEYYSEENSKFSITLKHGIYYEKLEGKIIYKGKYTFINGDLKLFNFKNFGPCPFPTNKNYFFILHYFNDGQLVFDEDLNECIFIKSHS
jgi:hypothetical protein